MLVVLRGADIQYRLRVRTPSTRTQALELQTKMEESREHKGRLERQEKARRRESLAYRVRTLRQLYVASYLSLRLFGSMYLVGVEPRPLVFTSGLLCTAAG